MPSVNASSLLGSNPFVLTALATRAGRIEYNSESGQQPRIVTTDAKEIQFSKAIFDTLTEHGLLAESADSTSTTQFFELSPSAIDQLRAELRSQVCTSAAFILDLDDRRATAFLDAAGYHMVAGGLGEVKCSGHTNDGAKCRWASHWKHQKIVMSVGNRSIDCVRVQCFEVWARLTAADRVTVGERFAAAIIK